MSKITALDAKSRFGELIDMAQRGPVTVTKHGRASVVVMSAAEYDRRLQSARKRFCDALERVQQQSASHGLTQAKLDELLADDS